jgi:hypothetical protein
MTLSLRAQSAPAQMVALDMLPNILAKYKQVSFLNRVRTPLQVTIANRSTAARPLPSPFSSFVWCKLAVSLVCITDVEFQ